MTRRSGDLTKDADEDSGYQSHLVLHLNSLAPEFFFKAAASSALPQLSVTLS